MRVVLDTNVFVSGIFWKGDSNRIINLWKERAIQLVTSMAIVEELIRVLKDFKIQMPEAMTREWIVSIVENCIMIDPKKKINICHDADDNKFIEAAVEGEVKFIITQDKHLLKVKKYNDVEIITPKEFLKKFSQKT